MKPSEALAGHRDELRQLVSRYDLSRPRVFGSVLTGTDTEESDLDLLVDATATTIPLRFSALPPSWSAAASSNEGHAAGPIRKPRV
jgi:predicted nucleotidyltransferase